MNTKKLVSNYGIYGLTADLAVLCESSDLKSLKTAERNLATAIAEEHVSRICGYAEVTPPKSMIVRVSDIYRDTYLDCYVSVSQRSHLARGVTLSFPDDADDSWRSFSWYKRKWNGDTRREFRFSCDRIAQKRKKGEKLTSAERKIRRLGVAWYGAIFELIDVLSERFKNEAVEYRLTAEVCGYVSGLGKTQMFCDETFKARTDTEALRVASEINEDFARYSWTDWKREGSGWSRNRSGYGYESSWMHVEAVAN